MWFHQNTNNRDTSLDKKEDVVIDPTSLPEQPELPGVYKLVKLDGKLSLIYESNIFKTDDLIFGNVGKRVIREWTRFCNYDESVGSLNVGDAGSGKTNKCDILANLAILKGNLPVIVITGLAITELELQFINSLNYCCIYLDEFDKTASKEVQNKMLSLLTNKSKKFLILYTGNNKHAISDLIWDRIQRARYSETFGKLDKKAVEDFMSLFDVREEFKNDFMNRYERALTFSMDNLKGIISEHLDYPEDTLDEILEYLNTSVLSKTLDWHLIKLEKKDLEVTENDGFKEIPVTECREVKIKFEEIKRGLGTVIERSWVNFERSDVESNIGGVIIISNGKYRLTYREQ